jgi:hypothetical protein
MLFLFSKVDWNNLKTLGKRIYIHRLMKKSILTSLICFSLFNQFIIKLNKMHLSFYKYIILDFAIPIFIINLYIFISTELTWKINRLVHDTLKFDILEYKKTYKIATLFSNVTLISTILTFNALNLFCKNIIEVFVIFIVCIISLTLFYISVFNYIWQESYTDLLNKIR